VERRTPTRLLTGAFDPEMPPMESAMTPAYRYRRRSRSEVFPEEAR
jgi:hypothetical protein